jgi:hypothetical protein
VSASYRGLPHIVRALGHVAAWAGYHAAGAPAPSRPAARLTYHSSPSEQARMESH